MNNDFNNYIAESKSRIIAVLDSFGIARESDITATPGPAVTLFEFYVRPGVRASKIRNLKDEFCFALHVPRVRVIAPTERGTVGIEVPNRERQNVPMAEMLNSQDYLSTDMELPLCIGRKVDNSIFMADLARMPHLLVAGATGMGKSVGLNVLITSLLNRLTPDELKLVLVDPKQVELSVYEDIARPYLACLNGHAPICTEPDEAKQTLQAVIRLMESRYTLLKEAGVRNIQEYNKTASERLPYYVVIIDEYGDLILTSQDRGETERLICRIAQKARAVGIHMIISTQRPDTKIVTGSIKANFPTRIAFRTTTGTDSRVILDRLGAERLSGRGDMLFFDGGDTSRVQCAFTSTDDVLSMCRSIAAKYADAEQTYLPDEPEPQVVEPKIVINHHMAEYIRNTAKILKNWRHLRREMEYTSICAFDTLPHFQRMGIVDYDSEHTIILRDEEEIHRRVEAYIAEHLEQ